jgi:hypothetical protein
MAMEEDVKFSPPLPTVEHDANVDSNAEEPSSARPEQDSYMGNGADESADVSGSVSGVPEEILVSVHQTSASNEVVAVANDGDQDVSAHANFEIKPDGKSYKYPLLKRYYEFGPWVGRNRKAICIRCKHQSASSQPERLIKHMKRCSKLSESDRSLADELLLESNANKKSKQPRSGDADSEYYADDDQNNSSITDRSTTQHIGSKRLRRSDTNDRKSQIDQALARFIMCCRIPLKSIHSREFVDFVRSLDSDYRIPSRETITNVLIPGLLNII